MLAFDGCNLTAHAMDAVVAASLFTRSRLRTLSLARNVMGAEGALTLARRLMNNDRLQTLELSSTELGATGAQALAEALSAPGGGSGLERLILGQNGLGDAGAAILGQALARGRGGVLAELDLSGNGIGQRGGAALASALAAADDDSRAARLRTLWLSSNSIGGEGAIALAAALERRLELHTIGVHGNAITSDGAKELERALRHGRAISRLPGLRHNDAWPDTQAARIEQFLSRNLDAQHMAGKPPLREWPEEVREDGL